MTTRRCVRPAPPARAAYAWSGTRRVMCATLAVLGRTLRIHAPALRCAAARAAAAAAAAAEAPGSRPATQGHEERVSRQRSGSALSAQRSRFSEQDLDALLDTTASLLSDDGDVEERAQLPPAARSRPPSSAVAQPPPPPPVEDAAPRYAPRGGMGGDDGGAGGSGRAERRPVTAGRRGWYNSRARRGSDADPDEHSFRPRERQRPAVDASDADAYYRDRLRTAQQDAGAEYDERYGGSDYSEEEEEEEYDEEEEDDYSRDARLAAQTRAEMAGQRRAARAHRRARGEEDNRRTADGRMLVDSDDEEGPSFAPLLDSDILKKVRSKRHVAFVQHGMRMAAHLHHTF